MIRTIIVDDEILSRIGIQSLIDGKEEVSVRGTFGSAEEALLFLRENPVDIVITDIEMPEMNGLEFIEIMRKENLTGGVIVLSCHENFSYAQEAISKGTDSYLLKHDVSEDVLLQEIQRAYQKNQTHQKERKQIVSNLAKKEELPEEGLYVLAVLRANERETTEGEAELQLDGTMLVHLLEEIVARRQMGTLFSPYNREIFIVFRMMAGQSEEEIDRLTDEYIAVISENMQHYINGKLLFGISPNFRKLKEMRERYQEALDALNLYFYDSESTVFRYTRPSAKLASISFQVEPLLSEGGMELFEKQLSAILTNARLEKIRADVLKGQLNQSLNALIHQVLAEYSFREDFSEKWLSTTLLTSSVTTAKTAKALKACVIDIIGCFRREVMEEWEQDDLAKVFQYIDRNLAERISLADLTDISHMSVPVFSKKFKERTGQTLVQFLNEKRIERARSLLKNKQYSLEEVAEMTGFSNANYLIRVFKKMTGKTVSEYRKQYGIEDSE